MHEILQIGLKHAYIVPSNKLKTCCLQMNVQNLVIEKKKKEMWKTLTHRAIVILRFLLKKIFYEYYFCMNAR